MKRQIGSFRVWDIVMISCACIMLLMACIISFCVTDTNSTVLENMIFHATLNDQEIALKPWYNKEEKKCYLFLPSFCRGQKLAWKLSYEESYGYIFLDDRKYLSGGDWDQPLEDKNIELTVRNFLGINVMNQEISVLISDQLPTMMITVECLDDVLDGKEYKKKSYIEQGIMQLWNEQGEAIASEKMEKFKLHGNLTATLAKKPFSFTLESPTSLCGMKPGYKWNLLANATDESYLRNKIILELAKRTTSAYEPDSKFIELYLNGEYQGLYLLTEAVNIEENRIKIENPNDYLLEMELDFRLDENATNVATKSGQLFTVKDVSAENSKKYYTIDEKSQLEQNVKNILNNVEDSLQIDGQRDEASDKINHTTSSETNNRALHQLIDLDSWAHTWLMQEISADHDTGIVSQFVYVDNQEEPVLYAGPVWDFDGTLGNVHTPMFSNPQALITTIRYSRPAGNQNQNRWLSSMYQDDEFKECVEDKYKNTIAPKLERILNHDIDTWKKQIECSASLDNLRWKNERDGWQFLNSDNVFWRQCLNNKEEDTLTVQVDIVKKFLQEKYDFLNKLMIEHRQFNIVEVQNDAPFLNQSYNQTIYYWIEKGQRIAGLPNYEDTGYIFKGYFDEATGLPVKNGALIDSDCTLVGVWEDAK